MKTTTTFLFAAVYLCHSFINATTIQIGTDIEDFSFVEQARKDNDDHKRPASRLYEISGIRTFPKAKMNNIQSLKKRLIVSHQQDFLALQNSGFVVDLWLVAKKRHVIQIKAHTRRKHSAFFYAGYGIKDVTWRGNEIVRTRSLPWKRDERYNDSISFGYDKNFYLIGDVLESFELAENGVDRVVEIVINAPASHDNSPLVPVHVGLAFYNDAIAGYDMMSVASLKVFYFDDVSSLSSLHQGGTPWRVIEGRKNSPLKKIANHYVEACFDNMTGKDGSWATLEAIRTGSGFKNAFKSLIGIPELTGISIGAMFGISDALAPMPNGLYLPKSQVFPNHESYIPMNDFFFFGRGSYCQWRFTF